MKKIGIGIMVCAAVLAAGFQAQAQAQTRVIQSSDCVATAAAPTATEGQSVPCSTDLNQNLRTTQGTLGAGETATSQALGQIYASDSGTPIRYTTTGDKNVKASAGELVGVMAATGTSVTVVMYDDADGTCSSGQVTGTISLTNGAFLKLPYRFSTGICITVGGTSPDLTVVYK